MAASPKRYSISVSATMKKELDSLKSTQYAKVTANSMLCDLILLGLNSIEQQSNVNGNAK
ncbi:MAG: hypothetical protein NC307_11225 [Roseburia sp.]|nr:hypothetical protein [Roseburia sp.]